MKRLLNLLLAGFLLFAGTSCDGNKINEITPELLLWVMLQVKTGYRLLTPADRSFPGEVDYSDDFARSTANIGDLDGNGVNDMAIGAPNDDDGGPNSGAVWISFLNQEGAVIATQKISSLEGGFSGTLEESNGFGTSVASLGDLNGDGINDIAVGSPKEGNYNQGLVWILFLNSDGTVKSYQKIANSLGGFGGILNNYDNFGASLASLGDLNGDGVTDLAVGASQADNEDTGKVWILFMNSDGTVNSQQDIYSTAGSFTGSLAIGDRFGSALSSPGDLDGDGNSDLAVGAPGTNNANGDSYDQGMVWILFLNSSGTVKSYQTIDHDQGQISDTLYSYDLFGTSLTSIGDLNGDGIPELAVGAPGVDGSKGKLWVLFMNTDGTVKYQQAIGSNLGDFPITVEGFDNFASSLANMGDINGDGVSDLAVGSPGYVSFGSSYSHGAIWLLFMDSDGTVFNWF